MDGRMDRQMDKVSDRDAKMNLKKIFKHILNQTLYQQITGLSISIVVNFVKLRQGNYCDDKQEDFYIKIAKHGLQLQVMTQVALKQNLDHNWTLKKVLSNLCVKTLLVLILHCLAKDGHWYPYPALGFRDGCCYIYQARIIAL